MGALFATLACRGAGERPTRPPYTFDSTFAGDPVATPEDMRTVVLEELARHESSRPSKADVDDAAFALELYLGARGYPFARVSYHLDDEETHPQALFEVQSGPQVLVKAIEFEGLQTITKEEALRYFGGAAAGGPYDERLILGGVEALRNFYHGRGQLLARVESPPLELKPEDSDVVVLVKVVEGPRLKVTAIGFEGGVPELEATRTGLRRALIGQQHGPEVPLRLRNDLEEAYGHLGWPDASVEVETAIDSTTGDVRLAVQVTPGDRVTLGEVLFRGNVRTREKGLRPLIGMEPGDRFDSEILRASFRRLYETGLFESVRVTLEGDGPTRDLVVDVVEARSVQVRLEPGWGSYEGPRVAVGIDEANFRGLGQRLSLEGSASSRARGARLSWVDPRFLHSALKAEISFFGERREEPSFVFNRKGVTLALRREWGRDWSTAVAYEFRPTNVDDRIQLPLAQDVTSEADVAELSFSVAFDQRDTPLTPTRGQRAAVRLEWADDGLGSQVEFLRARADYVRLIGLGSERVLAATARTGIVAPFGITETIPLPERFFNGGENSVRSFQEDELGPKSGNDPLGGESATNLGLELRQPIAGSLAAALFVDAGNVVSDWHDYLDFPGWGYAVGLGLRYLLPIGPVRVDLGFNPFAELDEDDFVLHFSVGYPY